MNSEQLRSLIRDVLECWGMYSESLEELLLLTAATESHCGRWWRQVGGPARGIFMMEPGTQEWIWNKDFRDAAHYPFGDMGYDLAAQIYYAARLYELRGFDGKRKSIEELAADWKTLWNTKHGKGTIVKAIEDYNKYVSHI